MLIGGSRLVVQTAALIAWLLTALAGLTMAVRYASRRAGRYAVDAVRDGQRGRLPGGLPEGDPPLVTGAVIFAHALVAGLGLLTLVLWLANDGEDGWGHARWAAFALAVLAAGLGLVMYASWRQRGEGATRSRATDALPSGIVHLHGLAAAATIVLVLVAAVSA